MEKLGKIAIVGGGSWATAIAKMILSKEITIDWYIHREDRIAEFKEKGHNPAYLTSVAFDTSRINFSCDINKIIESADTIIFVTPSPYLKNELKELKVNLSNKLIVTAIKGIIPGENLIVSDFFMHKYKVSPENIAVIAGPCHAEEVAKHKLSYLTVSCLNYSKAKSLTYLLESDYLKVSINKDVAGVEYGSVLKNVYAIAAGIYYGLGYGDNFHAVLLSNCIQEMDNFLNKIHPMNRNVCQSVYLGDLLVTGYSKYSRNRTFGYSIGQGHSVKDAQADMGMVAEGFYGTKCIHEINKTHKVNIPIVEAVYKVLYESANPEQEMTELTNKLK